MIILRLPSGNTRLHHRTQRGSLAFPAALAGTRTSPVDGINMNRSFPGDPQSTITRQISAFVSDYIFPMGDAFLDLHSGGSSLDILPSAVIEPTDNDALRPKNHAAALAFDAPITVVISNLGEPRTATATACRAGLITVATEMAGCGTVSIDALEICRRGTRNVLAHLGVLPREFLTPRRGDPLVLELPGASAWVFATADGVFEPFHEKGRRVSAGEAGGRIHAPWDPNTRARGPGLWCRWHPVCSSASGSREAWKLLPHRGCGIPRACLDQRWGSKTC